MFEQSAQSNGEPKDRQPNNLNQSESTDLFGEPIESARDRRGANRDASRLGLRPVGGSTTPMMN